MSSILGRKCKLHPDRFLKDFGEGVGDDEVDGADEVVGGEGDCNDNTAFGTEQDGVEILFFGDDLEEKHRDGNEAEEDDQWAEDVVGEAFPEFTLIEKDE